MVKRVALCKGKAQIAYLLILPDLTQSHSTRPVTVGLLHTTSGRRGLASGLHIKPSKVTATGT